MMPEHRILVSSEPDGEQFFSPPLFTKVSETNYRISLMVMRSPLLYAIRVKPKHVRATAVFGENGQ